MDSPTPEPEKPLIPPPDLPKPNIPPPTIPPVSAPVPAPDLPPVSAPPPRLGTPVVNVRIRQAGDAEDAGAPESLHVPFNTRVLAALIDFVVSIGIFVSAIWILPGFAERLAGLVAAAYLVTRDSLPFLQGQGVGKKAMNIRVVTLEDKPLIGDWQTALIRNGVLLIPFFALIEIFILLTREERADRGKRLGDEWAKTKVVAAPPMIAPEETEKI